MRRTLILGGTAWLGQEIARQAVDRGDEVVCLARGTSGSVPHGARLVVADRTRPGAYDALDGEWDEVVELSYDLPLVTSALDALADRAQHWTLVSTVSVYARTDVPGDDESADVVEPVDLTDYGQAKVAAERATASRVGDRLMVVRPGLIAGPGDPSDRFGYWVARLSRGGTVLSPMTADRYVQVIDVGDLAGFVVRAGSDGTTGVVDAVGDPHSFADLLSQASDITGFEGEIVEADDPWLLDHDVRYWAGPRSLPLWIPVEDAGFARRSNAAYLAAGGTVRPLVDTLRRTLDDEADRGVDRERRSGLASADEAALVAGLGAPGPASRQS
jgi:nucleoside-diphosphate-sugar epimerase